MDDADYATVYATFDRSAAEALFSRPLDAGANACFECCDRWAEIDPDRPALHHVAAGGEARVYTFGELRELSARFAQVLAAQGVCAGDRVAGLLPRTPELLVTILATWRLGAVYQPLFTAFGPKAIEHRLREAATRLVVTDLANRPKLQDIDGAPQVVTVGEAGVANRWGDPDFWTEIRRCPASFEPVPRRPADPFLMMFTSGTTGPAKALEVPLEALAAFVAYMRFAIDLRPEDRFWNLGDPGWAYGLYYAVTGPLALGVATTFYDGPFEVAAAVDVIRRLGITNLAGSPTAYRQIMAAGPQAVADIRGRLRVVSSAGEPLNPEVIRWFGEHPQAPVYDHYGQTEVGMVLCNHHGLAHAIHVGSAGYSMPGFRVVVLGEDDRELPVGQPGELAIDIARSPLFAFRGYRGQPVAADAAYYRSGDTVELNADGSISFVGRQDDVITSSGYRIGPFDVESALIEHPAVAEAAVVGKPDPERTEIVKAFVILRPGHEAGEALALELRAHVRQRLSKHAFPREIEFVTSLPKTPSGKIQRFMLREQERAAAEAASAKPGS
jgi:acetyl-CoA synthetase